MSLNTDCYYKVIKRFQNYWKSEFLKIKFQNEGCLESTCKAWEKCLAKFFFACNAPTKGYTALK